MRTLPSLVSLIALLLLLSTECRRNQCVVRKPLATARSSALMQDYDKALAATKANAAAWAKSRPRIFYHVAVGTCNNGKAKFIAFRTGGGGEETFYYGAKSGRFLAYMLQSEVGIPEDPCRGRRYYPKRFTCRDPVDTEYLYPPESE